MGGFLGGLSSTSPGGRDAAPRLFFASTWPTHPPADSTLEPSSGTREGAEREDGLTWLDFMVSKSCLVKSANIVLMLDCKLSCSLTSISLTPVSISLWLGSAEDLDEDLPLLSVFFLAFESNDFLFLTYSSICSSDQFLHSEHLFSLSQFVSLQAVQIVWLSRVLILLRQDVQDRRGISAGVAGESEDDVVIGIIVASVAVVVGGVDIFRPKSHRFTSQNR